MRFVISLLLLSCLLLADTVAVGQEAFSKILRDQVVASGFRPAGELYVNPDESLAPIGKAIFESKRLSLNGDIACKTCHLKRFGSADGIPLAAAIRGSGEGPERALSGAKLLPRNTLPFWGRGAVGFQTFFWDGRVDFSGGNRISQFGQKYPSEDPLVTAAHLPVVEIREMLDEDKFVREHKKESVTEAQVIYRAIASNLMANERDASVALAKYLGKGVEKLTYTDYARSLAAFIRSEFRIKETKLERFVGRAEVLSKEEVQGGLIFYGRGRCVTCHYGPHFSDFNFHSVAFPQLGFGKNGFGVDYGRFNVTFKHQDLYKFRTPPLYNVEKTAPYGHSGSVASLQEAVIAHFDPLRLVNLSPMDAPSRHEFYRKLTVSSETALRVGYLSDEDVSSVVAFLKTLSF